MIIIGISSFYHDSAAALIINGEIIAAAQEERFSRIKNDSSFPINAINYCIKEGGISEHQIDFVAFYDKPFLKFERIIETHLAFAPWGVKNFITSMPIWIKEKLFLKSLIIKNLKKLSDEINWVEKLKFSEHHLSHASSAFYPSPYKEAAILTIDGVGEWATTSLAIGKDNKIEIIKEIHFPHSLGLLYSAFTYYLGFKVNSGEYKVMGLAPYGEPLFADVIESELIDIKEDGSFRLNMEYFNYCTGLTMTNTKFDKLFGGKPRIIDENLTQRHMNIAASIQFVCEKILLKLTNSIRKETGIDNLCLAGGVALNCVANGKIYSRGNFKKIWIQPAAGDSGGALGAALAVYYLNQNMPRTIASNKDAMKGSLLGPNYSQIEIEEQLESCGGIFKVLTDTEKYEIVANDLISQKAIGWFQGRMEFGPRSLGARSILADPRSNKMQTTLNIKIKFRESFRPFAPSILLEKVSEWFKFKGESPYMLFVADINDDRKKLMSEEEGVLFGISKLNIERSEIPAVTHIDYTARIQTVDEVYNNSYYKLIEKFNEKTGCPILLNTSFNIRGEPIVCSPMDAYNCFMGTDLDILVVGNCYLDKNMQNKLNKHDYKNNFELD